MITITEFNKKELEDKEVWEDWFAWYPVEFFEDGKEYDVFWEMIQRMPIFYKSDYAIGRGIFGKFMHYNYRLKK